MKKSKRVFLSLLTAFVAGCLIAVGWIARSVRNQGEEERKVQIAAEFTKGEFSSVKMAIDSGNGHINLVLYIMPGFNQEMMMIEVSRDHQPIYFSAAAIPFDDEFIHETPFINVRNE